MRIYFLSLLLILSLMQATAKANEQDSILYKQMVSRDDPIFRKMFAQRRGLLTISDSSVEFTSKKEKNSWLNFQVSYDKIRRINRVSLIPNIIKIKLKSGDSYLLFTYRGRKIIRYVRAKL